MPALTVHNAEIRTAKVEVKTLAMSGKQVTLAVFRQLREKELINEDGRLNGQPWGVVNYHPDKCAEFLRHLHVVWQSGSDLFRDRVQLQVSYPRWITAKHGAAYYDAKVRDACLAGFGGWKYPGDQAIEEVAGIKVQIEVGSKASYAALQRGALDRYLDIAARLGPDTPTEFHASVGRGRPTTIVVSASAAARAEWHELDTTLADLGSEPLSIAESCFRAEIQAEVERRRRHTDARKALADLPQLFIAV
jgi:hypothetical protein